MPAKTLPEQQAPVNMIKPPSPKKAEIRSPSKPLSPAAIRDKTKDNPINSYYPKIQVTRTGRETRIPNKLKD